MDREDFIIHKIEEDLKAQRAHDLKDKPGELDPKWSFLTQSVPKLFINDDLTIKREVIRDFRRRSIFIPDLPTHNDSFDFLKSELCEIGPRSSLNDITRSSRPPIDFSTKRPGMFSCLDQFDES